jgi:hypothetical protein
LNFFALYFGGIWLSIPLGTLLSRKLTLRSLGNDFCSFVVLCIPLGMTFDLLPGFFLSTLDGARSDVTFYILLGDFALMELNKKKITNYGPIKNLSPPLERKRVP